MGIETKYPVIQQVKSPMCKTKYRNNNQNKLIFN